MNEVLRDPTGNRRYLCIEVTAPIQTDRPINYTQLYAQAMHAINHGERYWIDDQDEALIRRGNEAFVEQSPQEIFLQKYFCIPGNREDGRWMNIQDIIDHLSAKPNFRANECTPKKLGRALRIMGAEKKKAYGTSQYLLEEKLQESRSEVKGELKETEGTAVGEP